MIGATPPFPAGSRRTRQIFLLWLHDVIGAVFVLSDRTYFGFLEVKTAVEETRENLGRQEKSWCGWPN